MGGGIKYMIGALQNVTFLLIQCHLCTSFNVSKQRDGCFFGPKKCANRLEDNIREITPKSCFSR